MANAIVPLRKIGFLPTMSPSLPTPSMIAVCVREKERTIHCMSAKSTLNSDTSAGSTTLTAPPSKEARKMPEPSAAKICHLRSTDRCSVSFAIAVGGLHLF